MQKGSPHAGRALFAWLRGCGGCVAAWLRGCGRAEAAGHLRSAGGPEGGDAPAAEQQTEAERCPEGRRGRKVARWPDWSGRSGPERVGAESQKREHPSDGVAVRQRPLRGAPCEAPPARRPLRGTPPPSMALPAWRSLQGAPCKALPARRSLQGAPGKPPPCEPLPASHPLQAAPCGRVSFRQVLRTTASECRNG